MHRNFRTIFITIIIFISLIFSRDINRQRSTNQFIIKKDIPKDIPTFKIKTKMKLVDLIYDSNLVNSKSEVKRLIIQGAIKIDDVKVDDINLTLEPKEQVIKCGKRKFLKIINHYNFFLKEILQYLNRALYLYQMMIIFP